MEGHPGARRMLGPQAEQPQSVMVVFENCLPVVATLNHMVRKSGKGETGLSGHGKF
jgi:hypothetical protein